MNLVTFDIDDTLVSSGGVDDACFIKAVSDVAGQGDFSPDWDSYVKVTEPAIAAEILTAKLHCKPTRKELANVESNYLRNLQEAKSRIPDCFQCVPGAPELVSVLRNEPDFAVAFATGGWESCATFKLGAARIDFDELPMASGNDSDSKRGIICAAIAKAKAHWHVSTFDIHTHVGDRLSDYEAAAAIGCEFLAVAVDKTKASAFRARDISLIFDELSDTERLVRLFRKGSEGLR
ncbi:MAG TPA: hypothetical protein VMZ06_01055 [Candidatus Bathyarchaeia archaeon]|nr:hypothetical protein [Candidatus Bathyarchaeia archaeon]